MRLLSILALAGLASAAANPLAAPKQISEEDHKKFLYGAYPDGTPATREQFMAANENFSHLVRREDFNFRGMTPNDKVARQAPDPNLPACYCDSISCPYCEAYPDCNNCCGTPNDYKYLGCGCLDC